MHLTHRARKRAAAVALTGLVLGLAAPAYARSADPVGDLPAVDRGPRPLPAAATAAAPAVARDAARQVRAVAPVRSTAVGDLACAALPGLRLCSHGDDAHLSAAVTAEGEAGPASTSTESTRIGCYSSGRRVQTVYARPDGSPDRFAASLPRFRAWAGGVDKAVDDSARRTGGTRHVRFVSTPSGDSCTLSVLRLTLPREAFASFPATVEALREAGLDDVGGKYLVWADSTGYCGIASAYHDDSPGPDNLNNGRFPTYARIDRSCWGKAEAHELVHMLGGVQPTAPHATQGMHCHDGSDVMCYDDGTRGSTQTAVCAKAQSRLLDCRGDDYFSTAPAAGSWLARHWNTASSAYLAHGWTAPGPAPARPGATSSPAPRPSPSTSSRPATPSPRPSPTQDPEPEPQRDPLPLLPPLPLVLPTVLGAP